MRSLRKKMAAALIAVSVLIPCAASVQAEELTQPVDASGTINLSAGLALAGQCGDGLYYEFDPETGVLTIVGDGEMWAFDDELPAPWTGLEESIQRVVVKTGVTRISSGAFRDCAVLEAVELPETLTAKIWRSVVIFRTRHMTVQLRRPPVME